MHILMIRPYFEAGGATKTILDLATGLSQRGHRVSLAMDKSDWPDLIGPPQLPCHIIPLYPSIPFNLLRAAQQLRNTIQRESVDIVHSHHRFAGLVTKLATIGIATPHVATVHEFKYDRYFLTRLGSGQHTMTLSKSLRHHLIEHYHLEPDSITVVPPAIQSRPKTNNRLGRTGGNTIGCIARLSPEKGVDILLKAVAKLHETTNHRPNILIAGTGSLMAKLKQQAQQLQIANFVNFKGWQDNIDEFINQTDFLVLPSRAEGFGLVILEGWLQGRPTIGSNVGGIGELIQDGVDGLLVPVDDFFALSSAMAKLLENPALVRQMGEHGKQNKAPNYKIEKMVMGTEQIYLANSVHNE